MLRLEVTAEDLTRTRFAVSPAFELDFRLRAARLHRTELLARSRRTTEIDLLLALQSARYGPDFTVPVSSTSIPSIDTDLDRVRETSPDVAHQEIRACLARQRHPAAERTLRALGRRDAAPRIADALAAAWVVLVASDWERLRAVSERDILNRGDQLRSAGWAGVLADLHGDVRWRHGHVEIACEGMEQTVASGDEGMLLVPSVHALRQTAAQTTPYRPRVVVYPARIGLGAMADPERPLGAQLRLAKLLGSSRAAVLLALSTPATTSQLAAELGLAVGTVGDQLTVLRRAGLLQRNRDGRSVVYRRTPAGAALVRSARDAR